MSHFTVLVPAEDKNELEQRLLPYMENCCEESPKEYLTFFDKESEYKTKYEEDLIPVFISPDGMPFCKYDKMFEQAPNDIWSNKEYVCPSGWSESELSPKEIYSSFEHYMSNWGYDERDSDTGRYGYWQNENAKWDGYQIGGRWTGLLLLNAPKQVLQKNNRFTFDGTPGLMTPSNDSDMNTDSALSGDIDWDGMLAKNIADAMERYEQYHRVRAVAIENLNPEDYREEYNKWIARSKSERPLEQYALYRAITDACQSQPEEKLYLGFDECDKYELSHEEYLAKYQFDALTFAFIDLDGNWNERGEMHWFAIVANENPDYNKTFWQFVKSLPDDQRVFVVDCHI